MYTKFSSRLCESSLACAYVYEEDDEHTASMSVKRATNLQNKLNSLKVSNDTRDNDSSKSWLMKLNLMIGFRNRN